MARGSPTKLGLALLAIGFVITSTQGEETCRTGCQGSSQTFKYAEGTTYKYNFDSKVEVSLSSAEGQKSLTEVKALVLLTQQAQCNQILRVQNIQIVGSDGKKHSQIPDLEKPIRLNFHDGHVEDSICVDPTDSQTSLNIKRAIASLLQANLHSGHETDVFGQCPTDVSQSKDGANLVITKSRNLNRCAYRENIRRDFLTGAFNSHSEIKTSPLLNADYTAKLNVKNGILDLVTVHENYLYVPFSVGQNGAKVQVETKLKLAGTSKDNPQTKVSQPRSIIFEDPHPVNAPHSNVNTILNAVKETAKTIDVAVGADTAKEFINLIKVLRVSNKDDQLAVYNQVRAGVGFKDKNTGKKIFLDALLRAGNGDNVVVAIELLKNKELNDLEQKLVYLGLSLVRHPNVESLNAAVVLLNQPNLPREAYLGVGTLAGKFCRQHSCKNIDAVGKLIKKLVQKLGDGKAANRQEENDTIFVLKALRNIHLLDDSVLAKITAIAQDKKQPNRLRVAALETFLADPCKDKLRDSALNILKDIQQDSEVRIKAYQAAIQCANPKVANAIKALLDNEPSYQVGGYIVSHLRNARSSANPDKDLIKQHLGSIVLPKRFPVDLRKWSINGEFSYSVDTLGVANSVEGDIIYSQASFLPRSTSLNLTADVFGHSLNFLEISTRQENLDRLLEHYFGPKGLIRSHTAQELWNGEVKNIHSFLEKLHKRFDETLRARRDVSKSEIEQIGKAVQIKTSDLNKDLDLDLSVKTFGSELLFVNVNEDAKKYTPDAIIDRIIKELSQGLDKLKNFDETLRSNELFLDVDIAYPSSAGFPLRLSAEGAANIQVKANGAIDVRKLGRGESTLKLSLVPSANIEVTGRLTLDTWVVENGLKIITNLHTATGGDIIVQPLKNGIDVKLSLPVEKQNLVSIKHDIVLHTRELATPEHNTPIKFAQNKDFDVCLDQLSPFIGLTFCAEIQGPNLSGKQVPVLPFPLSGDAKLGISIEREDISLYHYRHVVYDHGDKTGTEIILEALGKNNEKKVALDISAFIKPEKFIKAELTSPITNALVEGRIIQTNQEKSLSVKLVHDKQEYSGKLGVAISGSADKQVYKPLVQYKTPQDSAIQVPPYRVDGQVIVEKTGNGQKYILDNVKLIIPDQKTITINGNLGYEPQTVYADVTISDGSLSGGLKGRLQHDPKRFVKYNLEITNSYNPDAGVHIKGELNRNGEQIKNFLQIIHGRDLSSKTNILTLDNSLTVRRGTNPLIETKNTFSYPLVGINAKLDFALADKSVSYNIDGQYNDVKLGSILNVNIEPTSDGTNYKAELDLWALNNRIEARSERKLTGPAQSQISNSLQINGKKLDVSGKIRHLVRPQEIDVGTDLNLKSPTHPNPLTVASGLKVNANELDTHLKVSSGNTIYADAFLKANKAGNVNGNIKVNLKNELTINGQVKAQKGVGKGDIVIESPTTKRALKVDSTFTIHEPNYNIELNVYPTWAEDKSKKITLNTKTKLTPHQIDSKNTIDILGHKLAANLNGNCEGDARNGKFDVAADVTLPNDHYISAKLKRDMHTKNNIASGNIELDLEDRPNKNTAGAKLIVKGQLKSLNTNEKTVDVSYQISGNAHNGKTFNVDLDLKRQKDGEAFISEIDSKIGGSLINHDLHTQFKSKYTHLAGTYELKSSCPKHTSSLKGSYDLEGESRPISGDIQLDLTTKIEQLKSLKLAASGSVAKQNRLELKGDLKIYADNPKETLIDINTNGHLKADDKEGQISGSLESHKLDPISIEAGYGRKEGKDSRELRANAGISYGPGKNIKGVVSLNKLPNHEYKLDAKLDTPAEKFKQNHILVHGKRNNDNTHHQNEITLTSDGKTWTINSDLKLSEIAPAINIKAKTPEGKLAEILLKVNKLTDKQFNGELKLINQLRNFQLTSNIDANLESVDDFHIKINANSPNLHLDKVQIEAQNKPSKTGRRIKITAKSGNKNLLEGSTSYTARQENEKLIVEGSGSFKVKEETKSANFKYIKQNLSQSKNGETGSEVSLDARLGDSAIDAELKLTNKQFRILNSYCEEKKQCAHIEVDVKTNVDDIHQFNQEIEVAIDLRKLGLSHEFGLKAVTNRKEWVLDHTVDVHFQSQAQSKYQYSLYIHPRKAGASLSTPKRTVAIEANVDVPNSLKQGNGKVSGEIAVYLDKKNKPNDKSALIAWLNIDQNGNKLEGEAKFTNPALKRPLAITFKSQLQEQNGKSVSSSIIIDVFDKPNQKIVITLQQRLPDWNNLQKLEIHEIGELKSEGLGLNARLERLYNLDRNTNTAKVLYKYNYGKHESILSLEASPRQVDLLARIYNNDLLKINSKLNINKDTQTIDTEIASFGVKPAVSHLEIKNYNTIKLSLARKETPNDKLLLNAGLIPGQIADIRGELHKNGQKKDLGHASVKLDEANFLKSDYALKSDEILNSVVKPIKETAKNHLKELQNLGEKIISEIMAEDKEFVEKLNKATPNFKPLSDHYVNEIRQIRDEIAADKTIKDISEFVHNAIVAVAKFVGDTFAHVSKLIEDIAKSIHNTLGKIWEGLEKEWPQIKAQIKTVIDNVAEIVDKATEITLIYIARILEVAEQFQPQLKELTNILGEALHDLGKAINKIIENIRTVLVDQWNQIYAELKNLPAIDQLRAEYNKFVNEGLPTSEAFLNTFHDIVNTIKDIVPTEELKNWVQVVGDYIEKKLARQPVDDSKAFDNIIKATLAVIQRFTAIITGAESGTGPDLHDIKLPLPVNLLDRLPKLAAVRFSPLTYLLKEDLPDTRAFWLSLINHPRNWVLPFHLYGIVAQGQHLFTFDGKHLTFPGNCKYLLARDALDGNFTIVGTYANGLLSAITVSDGPDAITVKSSGQVLVNNEVTELPARRPTVSAFFSYSNLINIVTTSGVHVYCEQQLLVCGVSVSGYYHGKLRGLLGNGNNEPYDDFTTANGKIVTAESEFGNSYKLGGGCPAVKTVDHHGHHQSQPACDKLFGWESSLRLCYPFVKTDNFKMACEHGLSSGVKDTELAIASAYVAACKRHNIPIALPSEFLKCTNGEKPTSLGDKFSVKTPGKAVDIVLIVDTIKKNEPVYKEYIQPLIQQITNELNGKGINDVEIHLIAYGGENQWPSHVTVNGKLTIKGKVPNLKFSEAPKREPFTTGTRDIDHFLNIIQSISHDLKLALGLDLQARTYTEAINYPFRAHALKSILVVTGNACEKGRLHALQILRTLLYRSKTINLNLITPFEKLTVDSKHAKDIVGFNEDTVFTTGGKKGKNEEMRKGLEYQDYCVDFTVQNNGNVFVLDHFLAAKDAQRKQFVQVTAHNIVDQFTSIEQGLDCECKLASPWTAQNVCTVVYVKDKVPKKGGTKA